MSHPAGPGYNLLMALPSPHPHDHESDPPKSRKPEPEPQTPATPPISSPEDLLGFINAGEDGEQIPFKVEGVGEIDPATLAQLMESFDLRRRVEVIEKDGRFPVDAYNFLQRGVRHTVEMVHGEDALTLEEGEDPATRHVGGRELAVGLRDLAEAQWGLLAQTVLRRWGITSTRDFGEMVFVLVDGGVLSRTDSDRVEDFDDVYPFGDIGADYRVAVDNETLQANAPTAGCCE